MSLVACDGVGDWGGEHLGGLFGSVVRCGPSLVAVGSRSEDDRCWS